jgi:formiminoglutamase
VSTSVSSPLSHDDLWPRSGGWPAPRDLRAALAAERDIDVALVGIPAYRTSLSPTNAHLTPAAVRAALRRYSPAVMPDRGHGVLTDLETLVCADFGDVLEPDSPEGEDRTMALVSRASARSQLVIAVGGDNSVTVATALGAWGSDISNAGLITLDAHYDLRDGVSNGSPVRRLIEAGLDPRRIVQMGIQDFANSAAYARRAAELGITVVHRDELERRPLTEIMMEALEIAGSAGGPIHVDLDADVCDRTVVPACPAALPGGISAYQLRQAARLLAADARVRSLDIAEIDASADSADGRTIRLAALCVLEAAAGVNARSERQE